MDITELSMMLETMQAKSVSEEEFQDAVGKAKTLSLIPEQQIVLYGLFKQYCAGDNSMPEPDKSDIIAKHKWDSWNTFKGFPKNNAALAYVYIVQQLFDGKWDDKDVKGGMDNLGVAVSTLNREYDSTMQWSSEGEAIFKATVENDLPLLKLRIENGDNVNAKNDEGMTALHFAADRGFCDILYCLLQNGANINAQDCTGQTPLMYAASCENKEIVEKLLQHGADMLVKNTEGLTVTQFEDLSLEIISILNSYGNEKNL